MCGTAQATDRRAIDAYAVALNETDFYQIDAADAPFIQRIEGVYLFDRNEKTHCCELTPSYWLIHLYDQAILAPVGEQLDDFTRDKLCQKYEYCGGDDCYVHCGTIDRIIQEGKRDRISRYGDCAPNDFCNKLAEADERHAVEMERIAEDLRGNCPF